MPKEEQKDFYWHKTDVIESAYDRYSKEYLDNSEKYNSTTINESLPELSGSEKQVSWAEDIRKRLIKEEVENIIGRIPDNITVKQQLIQQAKANRVKGDTFSDMVNYALKESKTYKWLKNVTSAKELIDYRYGKI